MFFLDNKVNELPLAHEDVSDAQKTSAETSRRKSVPPPETATNDDGDKVFFFENDVAWELLLRRPNRFPGVGT